MKNHISAVLQLLAILLAIFNLTNCQSDNKQITTSLQKKVSVSGDYSFLIFKKEKKIEIWHTCDGSVCIDSMPFQMHENLAPGIFKLEHNNQQSKLEFNYFDSRVKEKYDQAGFVKPVIQSSPSIGSGIIVSKADLEKLKTENHTKAYILPNDFRKSGALHPCFACPHWMTEIYAQLELSLQPFQ